MSASYRYKLTRSLEVPEEVQQNGRLCWIMLNPSTADEVKDDQTIRAVKAISAAHGYDRLVVVNLFAVRSTDPKQLVEFTDPYGPHNEYHIAKALLTSDDVVFAWGAHKLAWSGQPGHTITLVSRFHSAPLCLGKTKDGHPRHPCRLPYNTKLVPY